MSFNNRLRRLRSKLIPLSLKKLRDSTATFSRIAADLFLNAADQKSDQEGKHTTQHEFVFKHGGDITGYVHTLCEGYVPLLAEKRTVFFNGKKNVLSHRAYPYVCATDVDATTLMHYLAANGQ